MTDTAPTMTDEQRAAAEAIVEEAQSTFDLRAALTGPKVYPRAKARLFLDAEVAGRFHAAGDQVSRLETIVAAMQDALEAPLEIPDDLPDDERQALRAERATVAQQAADLNDRLEQQRTDLDAMREAVDAASLSVHMRGVPQVAVEKAERRARKAYRDPETGKIEGDAEELFFEQRNLELLGRSIEKVVDAQGREAAFDRETVGELLRDTVLPTQYARLMAVFQELIFRDTTSRAAVSDPGF